MRCHADGSAASQTGGPASVYRRRARLTFTYDARDQGTHAGRRPPAWPNYHVCATSVCATVLDRARWAIEVPAYKREAVVDRGLKARTIDLAAVVTNKHHSYRSIR